MKIRIKEYIKICWQNLKNVGPYFTKNVIVTEEPVCAYGNYFKNVESTKDRRWCQNYFYSCINCLKDASEPYGRCTRTIYIYWEGDDLIETITSRKFVTDLNYLQKTELTSYIIHVTHSA